MFYQLQSDAFMKMTGIRPIAHVQNGGPLEHI